MMVNNNNNIIFSQLDLFLTIPSFMQSSLSARIRSHNRNGWSEWTEVAGVQNCRLLNEDQLCKYFLMLLLFFFPIIDID